MALKYINIFPSKALQNLPKFGFLVWKETIWQPWMKLCSRIYVKQNLLLTSKQVLKTLTCKMGCKPWMQIYSTLTSIRKKTIVSFQTDLTWQCSSVLDKTCPIQLNISIFNIMRNLSTCLLYFIFARLGQVIRTLWKGIYMCKWRRRLVKFFSIGPVVPKLFPV
jgi:hypothetical protein